VKNEPLPAPAEGPADTGPADDPHWYKDAVIYELHIKAFADSTGDGIGDFRGLIDKLDHVRDLGVNTIWLLPFYPSPFRDDGYDVADFLAVHPAYGETGDVARLVQEAHRRGLRVITELVLNHTSDQHPLFQAARRAPKGSPERDFYVWSDDPKKYAGTRIIFTDTEKSNWTWDEVAGQYFWHRFFSHQPDLNYDNPRVREAVFEIMEFWLDKGVDGFRLDAIPYLVEREGTSNENLRETHEVIKELRRRLDAKYPNKLLLAEANMWPEDVREYFGDDDECHMAYHFPLMPRMYMAIAQEDRHPVVEILQQTPEISPHCQWAIFLRNHDELTLEMVTSKERDYMYSMYAADPRARINLGIRRRLAPLLENDRDRIKLMNSLLLSMPGSPVLYYGDEIGMGDNIFLGDRDGVRTPMQWSNERNGGFSRADPQRLYLPPIQDPVYGYEAVNVEAQQRDGSSLLNWTRRMLAVRRSTQVFGRGRITMLHPGNRKILAYLRELGDEAVLCVANLSRMAQPVELDLSRFKGRVPVEMSGHNAFPPVGDLPYLLTLPSHGFYWFRLATDTAPPDWYAQRLPVEDLAVLVLFDGWNSLFRDRVVPWRIAMAIKTMAQFEGELLPRFLARQRWFAGAEAGRAPLPEPPAPVRVADHAVFAQRGREWLLCLLEGSATAAAAPGARWFAPFALAWEDGEEERLRQLAPAALAKVRMQAQVGFMADAFADEAFCRAVVQAVGARTELRTGQGTLHFQPTGAFAALAGSDADAPTPLRPLPQSRGTVLALDERLLLKAPRRVRPGLSVELEMGRFLTDVARFEHSVPMAGSVEHVAADGTPSLLLLLQACVPNQGDAWSLGVEQLARQLERVATLEAAGVELADDGGLLARVRLLGQRTAELHAALARATGQPAFDPEPVQAADLQRWAQQWRERASAALALLRAQLQAHPQALPRGQQALAQRLLDAGAAGFEPGLARVAALPPRGTKTRVHGAYRLQEVLLVNNDFVIIDFEGDPERALHERRAKQSPLCDVAGMLRSFDQARQAALALGSPSEAEAARREPLAQAWGEAVRSAFVQAYGEAAVAAGLYADADDFATARALLELFEADLAWQQLHEELAHLPEAGVALPGALALLAGWLAPGA
jgi:maltose alpha-D-glucosyltransferase/alpha-amylase